MKHIFGIDSQPADLGGHVLQGAWDTASFVAIAIEGQGPYVCSGEIDGVPFKDDGSLCGIAAAEDRRGRGALTIRREDGRLQGLEGFLCSAFRDDVA